MFLGTRANPGTFSIVTPNYNMGHLLPDTIESVLTNLQPGDEYFIIDGGSTDNSAEVIRRYETHLAGWVSEPDHGYADALAKGFRRCSGTFLCWLNSSDLLLKDSLRLARELLSQTGADLLYGDNVGMTEEGQVIAQNHWDIGSLKQMALFGGWTLLQDASFWRRSLYERIGGIDASLKYAADYDFFLRASWAGSSVYVPVVFSAFRNHPGQKSISGRVEYREERQRSRKQMLERCGIAWWQGWVYTPACWLALRWRFRVARRFQRTWIPSGVHVSDLVATPDPTGLHF